MSGRRGRGGCRLAASGALRHKFAHERADFVWTRPSDFSLIDGLDFTRRPRGDFRALGANWRRAEPELHLAIELASGTPSPFENGLEAK
jgi:hypothetical protein